MSFGGSVMAMITSLKNNARPKRRYEDRFDTRKIHSKTPLKEKQISQQELEKIKTTIRSKLSHQSKTRLIASLIITFLVASVFIAGLFFLSGKTKIIIKAANEDLKQKELIKEEERNQRLANLIERGEFLLSEGDYESAKNVFNKAYIIDNKNKSTLLGTVKAYLLDCVQNDKECGLCDYYVKIAVDYLGSKFINEHLGELMERYEQKKLVEEQKLNDEVLRLLNNAYKALDGYSLKTAKHFAYKAYHLNPDKYETNIAILRIYIEDCLRNGDCYFMESEYNAMKNKYGETNELRDLKLLMETKN
ncbi:MAG: hypothetical protein AB7S69_10190 [Salinivirgaceae bacterium]